MQTKDQIDFGGFCKVLNMDACNEDIYNSKVKKVYVSTMKKAISIILSPNTIIKHEELDLVKELVIKEFTEFKTVNLTIKYQDIEKDRNVLIEKYWLNILYFVNKEIPSSYAWSKKLEWELQNGTLIIWVNNDIELNTLKKRNLDKFISKKINEEFNITLKIDFKSKDIRSNTNDEYQRRKTEEESKLLSNISINLSTQENNKKKSKETSKSMKSSGLIYGKNIDNDIISIAEINTNSGTVTMQGELFDLEVKEIKGNKKIFIFNITDFTNSITVKIFANPKQEEVLSSCLKDRVYLRVKGDIVYDTFIRSIVMMGKSIMLMEKSIISDTSKEKRVELHLHTKMSDMDGISSFTDLAKKAAEWGHKALAITDHGVVQGFPEAMNAAKKYGIKVLYGLEGYLINDNNPVVLNAKEQDIDCEYIVFDIETTGLSPYSDKIIEIGAVKIKNNKIVDKYSQLVNPEVNLPDLIIKLTGITDSMVSGKPAIEDILPDFLDFIKDSVLVAHNASFDMGFVKENFRKMGITLNNPVIDTLQFSRELFTDLKNHKLNNVAKHLGVSLDNHHRAVDDSKATAEIFLKCIELVKEKGAVKLYEINELFSGNINYKSGRAYHIVIFAKNYIGLKNLYKIVSESHINYFYRKPRIPKSLLRKYRDGLILGTACEAGELFKAILSNKDEKEIREIVNFYDYLEIQPIGNNLFLIDNGNVKSEEELKDINRKIVDLGKKYDKPVVATGDVHFLDSKDEAFRRILMTGKGFADADNQPPLYLKTTDEMLEEFEYLGDDIAKEVVIDNTNFIADLIDDILPIPDGTFPPKIDGAESELREITYKKALSIYGDPLPKIVKDRLDRELNSIISNGYAVLYIISEKLVKKSLSDGYLVGSRGSVGSSFVATMSDITEVNPLPPHYVCPKCKNSEFITDGSTGSGVDMEDKICPKCGTKYNKDGHDIPFETFLGFEGDKEPDIDLNFAGEYQSTAHQYVEELFGEGHVYRAGTIGTIADKTAYGFVKKYYDEKGESLNRAEANRLVNGCTGVKRTSGQHPGGVMVVPRDNDVHDFTPIQYPANDSKSGVITTHFDYHSISGRILKLDILGHDTPSIIRMLEDITGVDVKDIALDDKDTMGIFTSTKSLGISEEEIDCKTGSLGIPEFGTKFVRQMLLDTLPTTFDELVRISGLSHGTDVWLNNAQDLVRNGITTLKNVISTRDDIMLYLIYNDLEKKRSFTIMEKVRKGKGLTPEDEDYMREKGIPDWYIRSCKTIKYMFPKAHAVAYVTMSFRIAYFKVHHPEAFYATYFTTKAADFDAELIVKGKDAVKRKIKELDDLGNEKTAKEKNLLTVLEVVFEMYARGFIFQRVNLYKSHSDKFLVDEDGIIPPLKSLQGVGENAARNIANERLDGEFLSIEDLINRTRVTKTVIEALKTHGCLEGMTESNQLSLFNI